MLFVGKIREDIDQRKTAGIESFTWKNRGEQVYVIQMVYNNLALVVVPKTRQIETVNIHDLAFERMPSTYYQYRQDGSGIDYTYED